jgi:hypothetical protein
MSFETLGLAEPILRSLTEEGYSAPTPIQASAVPHVLAGRDLIGIAQTGTGKTAAFALPILNHLGNSLKRPALKSCRVLVLSPTRELSAQIVDSFKTYGRHLRLSVGLAIGGVPIGKQIRALHHGVDVLVAPAGFSTFRRRGRSTSARSASSSSTRPTACSTWASSTISGRCSPWCRRSARRSSSRRPCRRRSPSLPPRCSPIRRPSA